MRMLMLLAALAVAAPLSAQEADLAKAPRIEMAEFKTLHAANQVVIVDVRDDLSFAAGHMPGAVNIPVNRLLDPRHVATLKAAKKPIVLYCA